MGIEIHSDKLVYSVFGLANCKLNLSLHRENQIDLDGEFDPGSG